MAKQISSKSWINRYINVQRKTDVLMFRLLEDALLDIVPAISKIAGKTGIGAEVRAKQLIGARGAITRRLAYFWRDAGKAIDFGRLSSQAEAIEQSFDWDEILLARAIESKSDREAIKAFLLKSADKNIDSMFARVFASKQTLSEKVYGTNALSKGWVDRVVNSGLARGATAKEIARGVRDLINPEVPGGVSYAAMRLARTEINNAYHAQSIVSNLDKPWSSGMEWNRSRTHKTPDECDEYATKDNGFGPGVFSVNSVPPKPHPQCLCYVVPKLISAQQFMRELKFGYYDAWMEDNYPDEVIQKRRNVN